MKLDVLTLITPDPSIIKTQGLQGSTPSWTYLSDPDVNGLRDLVYIKGPEGAPWDWMTVGEDFIYQRLTENVWADPSTGKCYLGKGVPRFPRYIDYSPDQNCQAKHIFTVAVPQTNYIIFGPGGKAQTGSSNLDCRCTFFGPNAVAALGDLPAGFDWILEYERGGTGGSYQTMERLTHRQGFGRYKWEQFNWRSDGNYTTTTAKSQNIKILAQPCPAPVQHIF